MKSILYKDLPHGVPFTTIYGGLFVKLHPDSRNVSTANLAIIIAKIPTFDGMPTWKLTSFDSDAVVYELEEGDSYER